MSLSDCPRCWETPCVCKNTDDTDGWAKAMRFGFKVDSAVMMCRACGADRFKEPCRYPQNCSMRAIAK